MDDARFEKPGIEEWQELADAVVVRLTECVHVYKRPPENGGFMTEAQRQKKTDIVVRYLHRLHPLTDHSAMPSDSVSDAHAHDERSVSGLQVLFKDVLVLLPQLSNDMQHLLQSPWMHRFPNKVAEILFAGETRDQHDGLGSGAPEHGRLAAAMTNLMERESLGDARMPRQGLLHHGEPRRHDTEGRARWTEQNSSFLRTAGRVE